MGCIGRACCFLLTVCALILLFNTRIGPARASDDAPESDPTQCVGHGCREIHVTPLSRVCELFVYTPYFVDNPNYNPFGPDLRKRIDKIRGPEQLVRVLDPMRLGKASYCVPESALLPDTARVTGDIACQTLAKQAQAAQMNEWVKAQRILGPGAEGTDYFWYYKAEADCIQKRCEKIFESPEWRVYADEKWSCATEDEKKRKSRDLCQQLTMAKLQYAPADGRFFGCYLDVAESCSMCEDGLNQTRTPTDWDNDELSKRLPADPDVVPQPPGTSLSFQPEPPILPEDPVQYACEPTPVPTPLDIDECPFDPNKSLAGLCGCSVPDNNADTDTLLDCDDSCPFDPDNDRDGDSFCACPLSAGQCSAPAHGAYTSRDGTTQCVDLCPMQHPGSDGSSPGCQRCDACPDDPAKTVPGQCGCGISDQDDDGDDVPACNDACPIDPAKTAPGTCGCGSPETDSDGDGAADCVDQCPWDPANDLDRDGICDPDDACSHDGGKVSPGICGCGVLDTDTDGDGTPDCSDDCQTDPNKTSMGLCGCGTSDADTDTDGIADCQEECPFDSQKQQPGICGCGVPDVPRSSGGCIEDPPWPEDPLEPQPPPGGNPPEPDPTPEVTYVLKQERECRATCKCGDDWVQSDTFTLCCEVDSDCAGKELPGGNACIATCSALGLPYNLFGAVQCNEFGGVACTGNY